MMAARCSSAPRIAVPRNTEPSGMRWWTSARSSSTPSNVRSRIECSSSARPSRNATPPNAAAREMPASPRRMSSDQCTERKRFCIRSPCHTGTRTDKGEGVEVSGQHSAAVCSDSQQAPIPRGLTSRPHSRGGSEPRRPLANQARGPERARDVDMDRTSSMPCQCCGHP